MFLQDILEIIDDALLCVNADGKILCISESAKKLMPIQSPQNISEILTDIDWNDAFSRLQSGDAVQGISSCGTYSLVFRVNPPSSSAQTYFVKIALPENLNAHASHPSILHEELSFISNMNHELRTPLNPIIGFSELLLEDEDLNEIQREFATIINTSGKRLLSLINQTVDFARHRAAKNTNFASPVNVHPLLLKVKTVLQQTLSARDIQFTLNDSVPRERLFLVDSILVEQVLHDFLLLLISSMKSAEVVLNARYHQSLFTFSMSSASSSLTVNEVEAFCRPFFSGETVAENADETAATNLAIAASYSILTSLGGSFRVEHSGTALVFTFEIPTEEVLPESPGEVSESVQIQQEMRDLNILIAEDLDYNRKFFQHVFSDSNVSFVSDGLSAEHRVQELLPDILVMDIRLPLKNGIEVLADIRAKGIHDLPIVLISADNAEKYLTIAAQYDSVFLPKPLTRKSLLSAINQARMLKKKLG